MVFFLKSFKTQIYINTTFGSIKNAQRLETKKNSDNWNLFCSQLNTIFSKLNLLEHVKTNFAKNHIK